MSYKNLLKSYIFHADCHGVQSLVPFSNNMTNALNHMCMANTQRFAVWGVIDLEDSIFETCQEMIKDKEQKKLLLKIIKERKYALPTSHSIFKRFIEKIPNDELDPFYG